jgi:hypothetical protein
VNASYTLCKRIADLAFTAQIMYDIFITNSLNSFSTMPASMTTNLKKDVKKMGRVKLTKVGGEPIGLMVPIGYPTGVEEMGGVVQVYRACIQEGKTWEELLNYTPPPDDAIL